MRISKFISILFFQIYICISLGYSLSVKKPLLEEDKKLIFNNIDNFYQTLEKNNTDKIESFFHDGKIFIDIENLYIKLDDQSFGRINNIEDFNSVYKNFKGITGKYLSYQLLEIEYYTPYNYYIDECYFVELLVNYENRKSYEKFFIYVDDLEIFQYQVLFNPDSERFD